MRPAYPCLRQVYSQQGGEIMNVLQGIPGSRVRAAAAAVLIAVLTACGGRYEMA